MLVHSCSHVLFSVKLDSEFVNIMILVFFSLGIWPLACACASLNPRDPKAQTPFDLIFPNEFQFCPFSVCTCGLQSHGKVICVTHGFIKMHWYACPQKSRRRKTYHYHEQQRLFSLSLRRVWQKGRKCRPCKYHS